MSEKDIDLLGRLSASARLQSFLLAKALRDLPPEGRAAVRETFMARHGLATGLMDAADLERVEEVARTFTENAFDEAERLIRGWQ